MNSANQPKTIRIDDARQGWVEAFRSPGADETRLNEEDNDWLNASLSSTDVRAMSTTPKPFAVFDIDGTLVRWQLFHAIFDRLGAQGHLPTEDYAKARQSYDDWKNRRGVSFSDYERVMVNIYDPGLEKIDPAAYDEVVNEVFESYKNQVFTYTRELIRSLKAEGYLVFAISGSQEEIINKLADHYGFDDAIGTTIERKDGRFTGKQELNVYDKGSALKRLVDKHGATYAGSVAVGDSESDVAMLELVEHPVAFNPSRGLADLAMSHGWKIVLERKNVVYELSPGKSGYVLKI